MTLTYNELFIYLDAIATENNVSLTFAAKDFFFNLVQYCEENGCYDYETDLFSVEGNVRLFGEIFGIGSHRSVRESIALLESIGIIRAVVNTPAPTVYYIQFPYMELKGNIFSP